MLGDMHLLAEKHDLDLLIAGFYIDTYYSDSKFYHEKKSCPAWIYASQQDFRLDAHNLFDKNQLYPPWNKLYRTEYAQQVPFDTQYTLGEDLQFVLDYIALLGSREPAFTYTVLTAPLTFYDCSRGGTLSTRYHADYCKIWPEHFCKLNKACCNARCPQEDMRPLHRAELTVYAEGVADILRRDPAKRAAVRRDKAIAALRSPWLHALLERMRIERCYSAYYLPCRWRSVRLIFTLAEAKRTGSPMFGKLDWAGYYLLLGRMKRG